MADEVARCDCCGELQRFYYGATFDDGRRVRVQVEGWLNEVDGMKEAARLIRGRIRDLQALASKPPPPTVAPTEF